MLNKNVQPWILFSLALGLIGWLLVAGASAKTDVLLPDKLVILGTTDVKGKTSPCG